MWREGKRSVQGNELGADARGSVIFTKRRVAKRFGFDSDQNRGAKVIPGGANASGKSGAYGVRRQSGARRRFRIGKVVLE
jgi:hypothetical protein